MLCIAQRQQCCSTKCMQLPFARTRIRVLSVPARASSSSMHLRHSSVCPLASLLVLSGTYSTMDT